ncbi:hypothetical protein HDK90DRAFT_493081 [Phyllosticta capitalensis]|uniref:Secreted protein n=1 Tax=Phyllosticta capitalensis TaxID=121624 RepID=A0ABR1YHD8_9PEZI
MVLWIILIRHLAAVEGQAKKEELSRFSLWRLYRKSSMAKYRRFIVNSMRPSKSVTLPSVRPFNECSQKTSKGLAWPRRSNRSLPRPAIKLLI